MNVPTMLSARVRTGIITIGIVLATSMLVTAAFAKPVANTMQRSVLAKSCATFSVRSNAHKDTALDSERGIVSVLWYVGDKERRVDLPYSPKTNFAGCSSSARSVLTEVKEVYDDQVR